MGFSAIGDRKAKAEMIAAILAAAGMPLKPADRDPFPRHGGRRIDAHRNPLPKGIHGDGHYRRFPALNPPWIAVTSAQQALPTLALSPK